jgi:hypothetical protein
MLGVKDEEIFSWLHVHLFNALFQELGISICVKVKVLFFLLLLFVQSAFNNKLRLILSRDAIGSSKVLIKSLATIGLEVEIEVIIIHLTYRSILISWNYLLYGGDLLIWRSHVNIFRLYYILLGRRTFYIDWGLLLNVSL